MSTSSLPENDGARAWRGDSHARVLVEHRDGAVQRVAERVLREGGYDVAVCGGPTAFRRACCPVVTTGRCAVAEEVDVIVHALNPDYPLNASVLQALKDRYPETPIVVEVPDPAAERHAELLAGCHALRSPMTRASLLQAVDEALSGPGRSGSTAAAESQPGFAAYAPTAGMTTNDPVAVATSSPPSSRRALSSCTTRRPPLTTAVSAVSVPEETGRRKRMWTSTEAHA